MSAIKKIIILRVWRLAADNINTYYTNMLRYVMPIIIICIFLTAVEFIERE